VTRLRLLSLESCPEGSGVLGLIGKKYLKDSKTPLQFVVLIETLSRAASMEFVANVHSH
jgi:hypothetical protein